MNSESSILGMALIKESHFIGIQALLKDLENRWGLLINNYHEMKVVTILPSMRKVLY
ncbi:MAG: hypothetical protein U0V04_17900 [Spirosomataceae bacterium]